MHFGKRSLWLVVVLVGLSPLAFAHAILVRSTPADQAVVHTRDLELVLSYNSRIDASRCMLTLTGPDGRRLPLRMESSGKPAELQAAAQNLANGKYTIHWQVLASDGHITRGDITFAVAVK